MGANNGTRERGVDRESERFREAALTALKQLEWVVGYLHKIGKSQIARDLDRNRRHILEDLR